MVTILIKRSVLGKDFYDYELKGLSTDTKPTKAEGMNIGNNSLFLEVDTGDVYYFDGSAWQKVGA